jgi:hypothetical protein
MTTFQLFIDDDRYRVPTLSFLTIQNEERARAMAMVALCESSHHLGVALYESERRLFGLGSLGPRMPAD